MLNFLTFDTAYCLYPRATIVEKKSLLLKNIEDVKPGVRAAVRKYRRWGFTFIQLAEENDEELFHLKKVRWAMDLHAWSFDLPKLPQPYRLFTNYRSPAESTSWAITTYIDDYHRMRCDMWYDDPCIFPILHATIRIRSMFVDLLVKNEEYWVDMDHDVGGSDQWVLYFTVVNWSNLKIVTPNPLSIYWRSTFLRRIWWSRFCLYKAVESLVCLKCTELRTIKRRDTLILQTIF